MTMVRIFGYGSLVNAATHGHCVRPAFALGWRRVWREVAGRPHAILSAEPAENHALPGVAMEIDAADLPALDAREALYQRQRILIRTGPHGADNAAELYVVTPHLPHARAPILRSYLDVVLAGYTAQFGTGSPDDFYATTRGWHLGLHDDRAAPLYPRHQSQDPDILRAYDALHHRAAAFFGS